MSPASKCAQGHHHLDDFRRKARCSRILDHDGRSFIRIRYFALRDAGTYKGTIEVSQNVTDIRNLEGEKHTGRFPVTTNNLSLD